MRAEAVIAGSMEDVVCHKAQLQFAAKQVLTGSQVEIDIRRLPTLCKMMTTDEMPVELKGCVLGKTEIIDPPNGTSGAMLTDTALVGGPEIMKGEVAIGRELPPCGRLGRNLQL